MKKIRYLYVFGNHARKLIVLGKNQGLWLAEIELSSEQVVFEKPPWISTEVTTDHRYSNLSQPTSFSLWTR